MMNFSEALIMLKQGFKIARNGWNGKDMYLTYYSPVAHGTVDFEVNGETHILQPFILMKTAQGTIVPWLASQTDILADDWLII